MSEVRNSEKTKSGSAESCRCAEGFLHCVAIPDSLEDKILLCEKIVAFSKKTVISSLIDMLKLEPRFGVEYLINTTYKIMGEDR